MPQNTEEEINRRKRADDSAYGYREARTDYLRAKTDFLREGPSRRRNDSGLERGLRKSAGFGNRNVRRAFRTVQPKRALLAEMVMVFTILAAYDIIHLHQAPAPSHFIGAFIVFLVLEFAAQFGSEAARFAMYFGMLFLLGLLVVIPAQDGKPRGIMFVELAAWLTGKQVGGQVQGQTDVGAGEPNVDIPVLPPSIKQGQPRKMRAAG
jgi:hypothetical protein